MVSERNKGRLVEESMVKAEGYQVHRGEGERSFMETEGRGFSDFYRNTSEDLFLKSLMESSAGVQVPTMEMLGFKNLSQNFRADSEELFKSWLTNGENHGYNSSSIAHRTRLASRRMSTELTNLSSQQHVAAPQNKKSNENLFSQNNSMADEISGDPSQRSIRPVAERGLQATNLYLAKAWFNSSQSMTRSRSSELRKRYAAMQNVPTTFGVEAMQNSAGHGVNKLKQEFANGASNLSMYEMPNQFGTFMSPSNSSSSNFNTPQTEMGSLDNVSSVVSMLKGTLERKKMSNCVEKGIGEDSYSSLYHAQGGIAHNSYDQVQGYHIQDFPVSFQEASPVLVKDPSILHTIEGSVDHDFERFVNPTKPVQFRTGSQEPSLSESSAAPIISSGFDACDGPSNSTQTLSVCESSRKQVGNTTSPENGSRSKDIRERIIDNLIDDRKRGSLTRNGSITSAGSVDKGDTTKKRRVERSRKMAEAKEKGLTPPIPSDMQSVLKRCENLEKEVRSLKLNLSFMNRKDSEQTKQIEELQTQNEELADEKERLLEEIERIISETGKI